MTLAMYASNSYIVEEKEKGAVQEAISHILCRQLVPNVWPDCPSSFWLPQWWLLGIHFFGLSWKDTVKM